jgi:nitrogen fixation protein NifU and related proteins
MSGDGLGLYQRTVIEHNRSPRNFRRLCACSAQARGHSPLCGDDLSVQIRVDAGRVAEAAFQGEACAVATASASLLTEAVAGLDVASALALVARVCTLVEHPEQVPELAEAPCELAVLAAVREHPARRVCARLPWLALEAALIAVGGRAAVSAPGVRGEVEISLGDGRPEASP